MPVMASLDLQPAPLIRSAVFDKCCIRYREALEMQLLVLGQVNLTLHTIPTHLSSSPSTGGAVRILSTVKVLTRHGIAS